MPTAGQGRPIRQPDWSSDHRLGQIERLFRALGWHVVAPLRHRLLRFFADTCGAWLHERLQAMGNLSITRSPARPPPRGRGLGEVPCRIAALRALGDAEVAALVADLGGHDLDAIVEAFAEATPSPTGRWRSWRGLQRMAPAVRRRPTNHGAQLTGEQLAGCAAVRVPEADEGPFCRAVRRAASERVIPRNGPASRTRRCADSHRLELPPRPTTSTPGGLGDVLPPPAGSRVSTGPHHRVGRRRHDHPPVRLVNRRGVYATRARDDAFERHGLRPLIRWKESPGPHSSWGSGRRRSSSSCPSWGLPRPHRLAVAPDRRSTTASRREVLIPCSTRPSGRASSSSPLASARPRGARTSRR
jgi:pyruvate dehydrogenase E1 component